MLKKLFRKKVSILIWFCIGWMIALSVSAMWVCGTWNLDKFLDVGEVYDFMEREYGLYWNPQFEQREELLIKNFEESTERTIQINGKQGEWKWLYIEIASMNQPEMVWKVLLYQESNLVQEETITLTQGGNAMLLAQSRFDQCYISLEGQKGLAFRINKMQLYERFPEFSLRIIVFRAILVFACYLLLSLIWCLLWKKSKYAGIGRKILNRYIGILQYLFRYIINTLILDHTENLSGNIRSRIRVSLMLFLIFYMNFVDMQNEYIGNFQVTSAVGVLCILLIAALSVERRAEILDWRNSISYGWFGFWTLAFLSEITVRHRFSAQAPIMILVFGFLYFVIGNMENYQRFLADIVYTIEILFWFSVVFCICFRPLRDHIRYTGASYNPAVFAMFELVALVTFLGELEVAVKQRKNLWNKCLHLLGVCISWFFIWRTQSFTAIIMVFLTCLIFSYRVFLSRRRYKGEIIKMLVILPLTMALSGGLLEASLKFVPIWLDSEILFDKDVYIKELPEEENFSIIVHASTMERFSTKIKSLTSFENLSSARNLYWYSYLRDMNLWGHGNNALVRGKEGNPHNAVIGMAYRYGIFSAIPYTIILLYSLYDGWKKMFVQKQQGYGTFLPFGYYFAIIGISMADNVEQPWRWVPWIVLYLILGCTFPGRKAEKR